MKISTTCNLIHHNLYSYDVTACSYNILKSIGWNLDNIDFNNKQTRNVQIGIQQRDNKYLNQFITNSINNIINYYIERNNIKSDNIIIKTKDGIIINKKLNDTDTIIPIRLVEIIDKLIISPDRKSYIYLSYDNNIYEKGIYPKLKNNNIYNLFKNLNYNSYKKLCRSIEQIRQYIFNATSINDFIIVDNDIDYIVIKEFGNIKINNIPIKMIDYNEIDKLYYWKNYYWKFLESILIEIERNKNESTTTNVRKFVKFNKSKIRL